MSRRTHSLHGGSWQSRKKKASHRHDQSYDFRDDSRIGGRLGHPTEDDLSSSDFTLNDVYKFEMFVESSSDLIEDSSAITAKQKPKGREMQGSKSGHKTRKDQKRQAWQYYLDIRNKIPGFLKCLKGHPKHMICHHPTENEAAMSRHPQRTYMEEPHRGSRGQLSEYRLRQELQEKDNQIKKLQRSLDDYSNKLASHMLKEVSADETSIENISIKERPMNVADQYIHVQSNEWLNAKAKLDETNPEAREAQKLSLLCEVIKVARGSAGSLQKTVMKNVGKAMLTVCNPGNVCQSTTDGQVMKVKTKEKAPEAMEELTANLPTEVTNFLGDYLRKTCNSAKLDGMCKEVKSNLKTQKSESKHLQPKLWKGFRKSKEFQSYLEAVCRLTWKMSIQRPPMELDFTAERKTEREQDLHWNSQINADAQVCVVLPVLTHGNQVMAKGKVYLYVP